MFYLPRKVCFVRVPTVRALEKILRQKAHGFGTRQLMRPVNSRTRIRALARRFVFCEPGCFFAFRIAPVVPTCRQDVSVHLGLNEDNSPEWPPWPTKKDTLARIHSSQTAMAKDKTGRLRIAESHGRSDVPCTLTMNLAVLEHSSRRAKNKVDVPFDIAVLVVLASTFRIQRVLPTQETAVTKNRTVGIN